MRNDLFDIKIVFNRSVEKSIDSAKIVQRELQIEGFDAELVDGIWRDESIQISREMGLRIGNFDRRYARLDSVVGCFLSHFLIWSKLSTPTIILEHDARLHDLSEFVVFVDRNRNVIEREQIIMNIGHPSYGRFNLKDNPGPYKLFSKDGGYFPGTHAYFMSARGAALAVATVNDSGILPADLFFCRDIFADLLEFYPWPFTCSDNFTTVQQLTGCIAKHNFTEKFVIV